MGISLLGVACMALYCKNKWVQSIRGSWNNIVAREKRVCLHLKGHLGECDCVINVLSSKFTKHHLFTNPACNRAPCSLAYLNCVFFYANTPPLNVNEGYHRSCLMHKRQNCFLVASSTTLYLEPTCKFKICAHCIACVCWGWFPDLHNCFSESVLKLQNSMCWVNSGRDAFLAHLNMTLHRRQREKHRAHLTEIRNLRDCTVNTSDLMSKSSNRTERPILLQKVTPSSRFVYFSERKFAWCPYLCWQCT